MARRSDPDWRHRETRDLKYLCGAILFVTFLVDVAMGFVLVMMSFLAAVISIGVYRGGGNLRAHLLNKPESLWLHLTLIVWAFTLLYFGGNAMMRWLTH